MARTPANGIVDEAAQHNSGTTYSSICCAQHIEELGVDFVEVDEAHAFKNLFYVSKMTRIAGLPQTAS
ncbi:MAG: hypothetical protein MUE94_14120, partial [Verrucomicrobia bacterium]|nr:hypothetical protein [Verrucomicrobiota bacterium]